MIVLWTSALEAKSEALLEQEILQRVLEKEGHEGLLKKAGVAVHDIFYGEQGLSVFLGSLDDFTYSADEMRNIAIYEGANRSVVNITTVTVSLNSFLEVLPTQGTGSGIIISRSGYILTNSHVVSGADQIIITLSDGSNYEGTLIGVDNENDLAVVKIDPADDVELDPIEFGEAASLKVGQKVVAIGNPFGYDRTMTLGTVSGVGRPVRIDSNTLINGMIQTDAAINPGNSGGPLLDSAGRMVGICTSIYSTSGGSQGIGFAIPVETAITVIPDLIKHGKVIRGWLDVTMVQLDASIVAYADLPVREGLLISTVAPGGKAEKSGLRGGSQKVQYGSSIINLGGDIIVNINKTDVVDYAGLYQSLTSTAPGDIVDVTVVRNGAYKTFQVELVQRPNQMEWMVR
ncbi:MAG: trypsin-like peptidase domain-containing protein [Sphaerochaetaceae bacterium]|nr:trypsin-like peptidase domain-containing protein [Sphaerochaetaceae bacterium]